ncbi:MAG: M23 family metallopeptidase [Myxococcales bacterium]|nr:M23 family metallopeptidase [Myxococcales bacterium]
MPQVASNPASAEIRRDRQPRARQQRGYALVKPQRLPPEPKTPRVVERSRLARALKTLCGARFSAKRADQLAGWLVDYAKTFSVDPFALGALAYYRTRCSFRARGGNKRVGMMRIQPSLHRGALRDGRYHYRVGSKKRASLSVARFPFTRRALRRPEVSVYFAAALLSIYGKQCRYLDGRYHGVKHRHALSHMAWGDQVRGTLDEERVLRDRRRLLSYYHDKRRPSGRYKGIALYSPLDGVPRKTTSDLHARRGRRRHRGIDFYSDVGEPVRAIADGYVFFAGVQRRRGGVRKLSPKSSRWVRRASMGAGGLFVRLQHAKNLVSRYFHLSRFVVATGERVKAGQLIGYVGGTGIRHSRPHLHFEMRRGWRTLDPLRYYTGSVLPPTATYFGRHVRRRRALRRWLRAKRRRARRRREHRRKRRALPVL